MKHTASPQGCDRRHSPQILESHAPAALVPRNLFRMAYMYILECADRTLYVGSTRDLERRLNQHQAGEGALYTQTRLPVRLLYFEQFDRVEDAYRREKQIQGWSRSKRLALVHGRVERLPGLSKKRFRPMIE